MLKGFLFFAAVGAIFSSYGVLAENENSASAAAEISETRGRGCQLCRGCQLLSYTILCF